MRDEIKKNALLARKQPSAAAVSVEIVGLSAADDLLALDQ